MTVLDETALRRTNFREDLRVKLADGQEWWLSRPVIRTGMGGKRSCSLGPDYLSLWNSFKETYQKFLDEPEDSRNSDQLWSNVVDGKLAILAQSLKSNYDIDDDSVAELLMFDMTDSGVGGERETFDNAFSTAYGVRPKALATGSSEG